MAAGDAELLEDPLPPPTPRLRRGRCSTRLPALLAEAQTLAAAYRELLRAGARGAEGALPRRGAGRGRWCTRAPRSIDVVLREAWRAQLVADAVDWALVAVGGYGRGELHPCSDIDILLLRARGARRRRPRRASSSFVTFLWDIGLEVGHSVRTVEECAQESAADVSVMTTLLEARLLAGNAALLGADARGARARAHLAGEGVLRSQGARAGRAPPQGQRHRLQPRAEREDRARAACATSRPSPGSPSATSAPTRSTSSSTHGFLAGAELRAPEAGAGVPVEGALRPARR